MIPYPENSTAYFKQASVQPLAVWQILSLLQASVAHRITSFYFAVNSAILLKIAIKLL